jgi:biopolymer transport protein ExbB
MNFVLTMFAGVFMMRTARVILLPFLLWVVVLASVQAAGGEAQGAAVEKITLWGQIYEGGWVMIPIGICSVLTVYLSGDGWMRTSRDRMAPVAQEKDVKRFFRHGDYVGAYNFCKAHPSPLTNVLKAGVGMLGEGKSVAEESMVAAMHQESSKLNTFTSYLSVIGVCTPMIGLLGTVTGMIKAFQKLGAAGIGDPSGLSAAIGEVLVATASGLFIAIPAFGMFYLLRSRSTRAMHHIQNLVAEIFRKMPYEHMVGLHISGEELYAATPNWVETSEAASLDAKIRGEA